MKANAMKVNETMNEVKLNETINKVGHDRPISFFKQGNVWRNKRSLHKRRSEVMPPTQIIIGLNFLLGAKSEMI